MHEVVGVEECRAVDVSEIGGNTGGKTDRRAVLVIECERPGRAAIALPQLAAIRTARTAVGGKKERAVDVGQVPRVEVAGRDEEGPRAASVAFPYLVRGAEEQGAVDVREVLKIGPGR